MLFTSENASFGLAELVVAVLFAGVVVVVDVVVVTFSVVVEVVEVLGRPTPNVFTKLGAVERKVSIPC